ASTGIDACVLIHAPAAGALLQPRAADTWWAVFTRADTPPASLVQLIIDQHTTAHAGGVVFLDTQTTVDNSNVFVRAHGDAWQLAQIVANNTQPPIYSTLTAGELTARLNELMRIEP